MRLQTALTIAGSDCSGGAGIQADLKTITMNGVYAMSVVTALTAQNTTGVRAIQESTPDFLRQQLDAVFEDIVPDAVKIGMVSSSALIAVIAERLRHYQAKHVVVDPVMVATSGARLIDDGAAGALVGRLLPLARVITPNIPEAEALLGESVCNEDEQERAALALAERLGCAVLVKGGHGVADANDVLVESAVDDEGSPRVTWLRAPRVETENTHGTGCALSSAIACGLAEGLALPEAVSRAKDYLTGALSSGLDLGRGSGPVDHMWRYRA